MAKSWDSLIIKTDKYSVKELEQLLGVKSISDNYFKFEIFENYDLEDEKESSIQTFTKLIESKVSKLNLGIEDILLLWITYEYDDQCSFEFDPKTLLLLGKNNISLCINAYQFDENQDNWKVKVT
jgi:hypothetical protein